MLDLDTGAAADLVCFKWLERHNEISERYGVPRGQAYLARARLKFGDGRSGEIRCAADIPAIIAGNRGVFTAFVLGAATPALSRKGALGTLGGQLGFSRDISTLRKRGVEGPHRIE